MMYTVTINFGGFIGWENTYEVEADSREEAEEMALDEARWDLDVVDVEEDEEV